MSVSFEIASSSGAGSYRVDIVPGLYDGLLKAPPQETVVVCDQRFAAQLTDAGCRAIPLRAEEQVKSLDHMPQVILALRRLGTTRSTHLLALGGGIVQDVAAFCSSIYMRGLTWNYLPTTLLGMADSCIGGKSSINVGDYKNIVGTFYPPRAVQIDPCLAATLSTEQMVAGLCEAAKICFCRGAKAFASYRALAPTPTMGEEVLAECVTLSLRSKKWFIEIDEFDRGERLLLNFGHTFGHAIEGASHYRISHGIAVGVGMLSALALGRRTGVEYGALADVAFLESHIKALLHQVPGLGDHLRAANLADLIDRFQADKKHGAVEYKVVTVDASGRPILQGLAKSDESLALVRQALTDSFQDFL